ncbi:recombinase family protein [Microtetraspora malaysiensis]|uniref:recombinase family protein n=1 Tax=Microtetraspora malaysiensis TaxID=161358 RepID=UPI003D8F30D6
MSTYVAESELLRRNAWSRSGILEMLLNPKYTGQMVWNRKATTSHRGTNRSMLNPPSAGSGRSIRSTSR